jgi:hypothetical protein
MISVTTGDDGTCKIALELVGTLVAHLYHWKSETETWMLGFHLGNIHRYLVS